MSATDDILRGHAKRMAEILEGRPAGLTTTELVGAMGLSRNRTEAVATLARRLNLVVHLRTAGRRAWVSPAVAAEAISPQALAKLKAERAASKARYAAKRIEQRIAEQEAELVDLPDEMLRAWRPAEEVAAPLPFRCRAVSSVFALGAACAGQG